MKSKSIPVAPGHIKLRVNHIASGEYLGTVVVPTGPYNLIKHLGGFKAMRLLNPDQISRFGITAETGIKVEAV